MTQLSKLAILGIALETDTGTYVEPTDFIPFTKCDYEDVFAAIKDNSYRGNDSDLQGLYQGVSEADWGIDLMAYPTITGYLLRGMIGPDTVTAGTATTLAALSALGATTLSSTATIAVGSIIQVDTGSLLEYAKVTAVSGSGPYALTVTTVAGSAVGMTKAHASGVAVVAASRHVFAQSIDPADRATFSFTIFDTLGTKSYSGAAMSDLDIKIDPKNAVSLATKFKSFQNVDATDMTPSFTALPPALGWQWTMTNAGGSSTRGLSYDMKVTRKLDVIHSSDGRQSPREIFQGALDVEATYKAIYENQTDLNLFLNWVQSPVTALLTQPVYAGGSTLALTMSKSGFHKGKREWANYVEATFNVSGIYNATDGGILTATLYNFRSDAY